jgi:dolichyl-diphosphooligosaccharide---protein glycosyltransferase
MLRSEAPHFAYHQSLISHRYIPIIASVSEHQPTAWPSFFMDLHFMIFVFPAGVLLCFKELRDEHVFVILYAVVGSYFAGVMVRLMLTLTPVVCVSAAVAVSQLLDLYLDVGVPEGDEDEVSNPANGVTGGSGVPDTPTTSTPSKKHKGSKALPPTPASSSTLIPKIFSNKGGIFGTMPRILVLLQTIYILVFFVSHCTYITSSAYSSPSVVLSSKTNAGDNILIDDFREAYYWLRMNTKESDVVMSWWDYGYQIAGMADRPTMVDNNTWNNSMFCPFLHLVRGSDVPSQHTSQPSAKPWPPQKRTPTPFS